MTVLTQILTATVAAAPADLPSWGTYLFDLAKAVIGVGAAIIGFLMIRTLNKIDANQTRIFQRMDELTKEFYALQGEHNAMMGQCPARSPSSVTRSRLQEERA